ncbi:MAG: hypothetical protein J3K34DRAFT_506807 [Monoraphidium minutum]|nr:MAG: hypothetical protein J3K34DRAFT_506807 [Monoraphidium minutum]
MAAQQQADEDDAWGPSEDSHASGAARERGSGAAGSAAPNGTHGAADGGGARRPSCGLEDTWRLLPLRDLRLSPAGSGGCGALAKGAAAPAVPTLQRLALGVVARHVAQLVASLGPAGCGWLPAEVKASLLAAARRRGELGDAALAALADASFSTLDVSGSRVTGAALLAVAARMPALRALDVAGCERVGAGALRKLPRALPAVALLRLGGGPACDEAAAKALPKIVPAIAPEVADEEGGFLGGGGCHAAAAAATAAAGAWLSCGAGAGAPVPAHASAGGGPDAAAAADSWEELAASEDEGGGGDGSWIGGGGAALAGAAPPPLPLPPPAAGGGGGARFWQLRAVVWPGAPRAAREALQLLCPRVVLNPPRPRPGSLVGELPRELDPGVPLDAAAFEAVGPAALEDLSGGAAAPGEPAGPSVADRFRQAYIDREARRRGREARLAALAARRGLRDALRRSGGAREVSSWMDAL